jgi:hypothetical protein
LGHVNPTHAFFCDECGELLMRKER